MRQGPAVNTTLVGRLELGTQVVAECYVEGQNITSSAGSTNLWLRIQFESGPAYVSALYVDTGDDLDDGKVVNCAFG